MLAIQLLNGLRLERFEAGIFVVFFWLFGFVFVAFLLFSWFFFFFFFEGIVSVVAEF